MNKLHAALAFTSLVFSASVMAQSPIGGFMQGKGKGNIVLSYTSESYDDVFLSPKKINGVPVFNKVKINSFSLYGTVGLSSKLDLVASVPYIKSTGEASDGVLTNLNYKQEQKGIQDVSVYLKYNPFNFKTANGNVALIGALGIQAPLGDYKVNEGLQSINAIGNRATQINAYVLAQYKLNGGFFVNGQLGYSLRSTEVPDAFISEIKVGYAAKQFYVDVYGTTQISSKGADILADGFVGSFPATEVTYNKVGVNIYIPIVKNFGIAGGGSTITGGKNIGALSSGYGALIFNF